MEILSKKEFCYIIGRIQAAFDADLAIEEVARVCESDFLGSDLCFLSNELEYLLARALDVSIVSIDYFCFSLDFGRNKYAKANEFKYYDKENEKWVTEVRDLSDAGLYYDHLMNKKKLGMEKFE